MHTIFLIQTYLQGGNKVQNKLSLKIVPCNMQVMKGQIKCNLLLGWNPFTERITILPLAPCEQKKQENSITKQGLFVMHLFCTLLLYYMLHLLIFLGFAHNSSAWANSSGFA